MNRKPVAVAFVAAAIAATSVVAHATSLGGIVTTLGAGNAPVPTCDADGFDTAYAVTGTDVTAVTVSGIADPGCEGARLSATVTDAAGNDIGSSSTVVVATDGDTADNSETLPLTPQPLASSAESVHLSLVGP